MNLHRHMCTAAIRNVHAVNVVTCVSVGKKHTTQFMGMNIWTCYYLKQGGNVSDYDSILEERNTRWAEFDCNSQSNTAVGQRLLQKVCKACNHQKNTKSTHHDM